MDAADQIIAGGMSPQAVQVNKAIEESDPVRCECGSITFMQASILKKVPGLYVGKTTDQLFPIPVYVCTQCGKIAPELLKNEKFAKIAKLDGEEKKSTIIQ